MTAAEARRLSAYPGIEVGAHSVHHLSLPDLAPEDLHREVFESRSTLERLLDRPATAFAYPYGDLSPDAVAAVQSAAFATAVGCEDRVLRAREHPFKIPRFSTREESGLELEARLLRGAGVAPDIQ
jgi:peptidoglycan/xylan/chitin deacetylase (PgdA/CDA1 family)